MNESAAAETRSSLANHKDTLELSANIATNARNDELVSFFKDIIDAGGYGNMLEIRPPTSKIKEIVPDVYIRSTDDSHIGFRIHIEVVNGYLESCVTVNNWSYIEFKANCQITKHIKFMLSLIEALPKFNVLINSSMFKSYEADINEYLSSAKRLDKFDNECRSMRIRECADAFKVGMQVKSSSLRGRVFTIINATKKRVKLDKSYFYIVNRKTIARIDLARWVVDGTWAILPTIPA